MDTTSHPRYHHHGEEELDPTVGDIFTHFVHHDDQRETGVGANGIEAGDAASGIPISADYGTHPAAMMTPVRGGGLAESSSGAGSDSGASGTPSSAPLTSKGIARPRTSRSRKGRPTRLMLPQGTPTGTAYVNVGRAFPGITMVYRCPYAHCQRYYATKLALRRHFVSYNHLVTTEYVDFEGGAGLPPDEAKRKAILSIPRCFKCPVLECHENFADVYGLCGHFSETHATISEPTVTKRQRSTQPVHELMEWTEMWEDCIDMTYNFHVDLGQCVPDMFNNRDDKAAWRFLSIFDIVGPHPSMKRTQFVHHLRRLLLASYQPSMGATVLVGEDILKLLITVAFAEMMPYGYMLTRDYTPSSEAHLDSDGILDPWNDDPFMWNINAESVHSMLKYGAVHSSRNYVKKAKLRRSMTPDDDPEALLEKEDLSNDRFVCQVPGCGKIFASVPAYKYHMHHFEHDLEALLGSSVLIRHILFPDSTEDSDTPNWYSHDRVHLRFTSSQKRDPLAASASAEEPSEDTPSVPLISLIYSVNDAVHILHGYIDQQLPITFSWGPMRKRELTAIHPLTHEFTLTFKKGDTVSMMKAAPGSKEILLTTEPQKRKKKPFLFPPSTMSTPRKGPSGVGGASGMYGMGAPGAQLHLAGAMQDSSAAQALGMDPWTLSGPIPCDAFRGVPGLEMKFLPASSSTAGSAGAAGLQDIGGVAVTGYQQSKLILPIHPTGLLDGHPATGMMGEDPNGSGASMLMGTWLDYSSVLCEEDLSPISHVRSELESFKVCVNDNVVPVSESFLAEVLPSGKSAFALSSVVPSSAGPILSPMACLDWFPHMAPLDGPNSGRFALALITAGSQPIEGDSAASPSDVMLWNVVISAVNGSADDKQVSYKIESVRFNSLLQTARPDGTNPSEDLLAAAEAGLPAPVHNSAVVSVKWYPFTLQADTNEADLKGMLAVLYSNGELLVYVLPRHTLFPENVSSPHYRPQRIQWKEICRITIQMYSITCFCWNKQQTILPATNDLNAAPSTVMTTQIILGTKEGSVGICDLSMPSQPQMLMLVPAHQAAVTSIDWSPLNPLSVVTASMDGTVHLWNLADMYHSLNLATAKGPFLQAQWLYTLSKAYDSRTASSDYAPPPALYAAATGGVPTASPTTDFDPARHVLIMDDTHYCKVVHADEPSRAYMLPSAHPRTWCAIYPNSRLQSPLIATADWVGHVELVAFRDEADLNKSMHRQPLLQWSYDPATRAFTGSKEDPGKMHGEAQELSVLHVNQNETSVGFTAVRWHLLPIGIFAAVSHTGLIYIHAL